MRYTVKLYGDIYKVTYYRTAPHTHEIDPDGVLGVRFDDDDPDKLAGNLARARSRIRELALCNPWEWFATLTLNEDKQDRFDLNGYVHDLGVWIGNYNKRFSCKLKYLLIPEQHKNGAWHMHGFFHDVSPHSLVKNEHGYMDLPYYAKRFGFISLSAIRDKNRCSSYITKYVTKSIGSDVDLNKHVFYHSRGLQGAVLCHEGECNHMPEGVWYNDYVGIEWFNDYGALTAGLARLETLS